LLGRKVFIEFEGAMQVADVWVNGQHSITHYGGYLPFLIDITDRIHAGDNVIAVRLDNRDNQDIPPGKLSWELDFLLFGGIYRNVNLVVSDKLHITHPFLAQHSAGGTLVTTTIGSSSHATVAIETEIINEHPGAVIANVRHSLVDSSGRVVAEVETGNTEVAAGRIVRTDLTMAVENPRLWHPDHPELYWLETQVLRDGELADRTENRIGIRSFELRNDGFYLNGKRYFVNGTNRHQEYPYVGYAMPDSGQRRDAYRIKSAGFDLVRVSHYPQSEAFMDACDELGLLVMDCIPGWQFMGGPIFRNNAMNDTLQMIRRDRNRTCVAFWEVSLNETRMDQSFIDTLNFILDGELSADAIGAGWLDNDTYDFFIPARQHAAPPEYFNNYGSGRRLLFIAEYGDWKYHARNAGFYQSDFAGLQPEERSSRQLRGFGEQRLLQQALNFQEAANSNRRGASTIGDANWLMFDYNRGYAGDIEASGVADLFRIPKFSYYFYQSQRHPVDLGLPGVTTGPVVHTAGYWQPDSSTDIRVFSNCDEVGLYLNDTLIGRQLPDDDQYSDHLAHPPFTFHIDEFTPGTLRAIAYIDGEEAADHTVTTPGAPAAIELDLAGVPVSRADRDLVFVYARVVDEAGTLCPLNGIPVHFSAEVQIWLVRIR
jgi:beta-galactosidase